MNKRSYEYLYSNNIESQIINIVEELERRLVWTVDPDMAVGDTENHQKKLLLCWDNGTLRLEIEIFPSGYIEYFYLNRSTQETEESEHDFETLLKVGLPDWVKEKLSHIWLFVESDRFTEL